jgi:16S rRNA (uracil1498-N3)-methyltransferase
VNPVLRSSAAHVFVESLEDPRLQPADEHHLRRVLRVRHDQTVTVSDGAGHWMPAHLLAGGLERAGERAGEPPLPPARVAVAIPKGERVDLVVQKLTELGVTEIILAATDRGVVRWDAERAGRQTQRLTTIARAAASQSRRVWLPAVRVGWDVAGILARYPDAWLADPDGETPSGPYSCVIVGPEGGFSDRERALVPRRVRLARHILRVETAAIAAAVCVAAAP